MGVVYWLCIFSYSNIKGKERFFYIKSLDLSKKILLQLSHPKFQLFTSSSLDHLPILVLFAPVVQENISSVLTFRKRLNDKVNGLGLPFFGTFLLSTNHHHFLVVVQFFVYFETNQLKNSTVHKGKIKTKKFKNWFLKIYKQVRNQNNHIYNL